MADPAARLEELAKNYSIYGDITVHKYCDMID
jgi:hypothetical protein